MKQVSDEVFEAEVLKAKGSVLVDFWAPWCGPCRQIAPVLEEISQERAGKVEIVKMNIDENPLTPAKYAVRGIPTMMLFKDGALVDAKIGAHPKSRLLEWLDSRLD